MKAVYFSVNEFDGDGDISDEGIYLDFGDARVKVADDPQDYKDFIAELQRMEKEISEVCATK